MKDLISALGVQRVAPENIHYESFGNELVLEHDVDSSSTIEATTTEYIVRLSESGTEMRYSSCNVHCLINCRSLERILQEDVELATAEHA